MIGTIQKMIKDMEHGVYDFTKDGKCSRCGACCSDLLPISESEYSRINLDGFDYAIETAMSMIKQIIHSAEIDNEALVHNDKINDEHDMEEFDLHGLLELLGCRVIAQFSEREK